MGKTLTTTIRLAGTLDASVDAMIKKTQKLIDNMQKSMSGKGQSSAASKPFANVEEAIKKSSQSMSVLGKRLNSINDGLKLNPTSLNLITQKQQTLGRMIDTSKTKLAALKQTQQDFISSGGDLGSDKYQELCTEIQNCENALERLNGQQNNFSPKTQQFGARMEKVSEATGKAAKAMAPLSTAAAAGIGGAIKTAANFEKSMSQVYATMGDAAKDSGVREELINIAKEQGRATKFSASEAADALNYLALAGYNTEQMGAALPNILSLASAGNMDLAKTSDMVTDSMAALGKEVTETNVKEFGDQMAKASSITNTSVEQLGEAYLTVGGTGKVLKGGTVEMATALGILADNGIKGAEGGTALRNTILSLTAPTDKAQEVLNNLGVSAFDADGNMRALPDTLNDLNTAMSGMNDSEKQEVISTLFNKADLKSVNALLANSGDRWNEVSDAIANSSDAASQMAAEQQNNLSGQLTQLSSAFEGIAIDIGEAFLPTMKKITGGVQKAADWFNKLGPQAKSAMANVLIGTAAAAPTLLGLSKITGGIGKFIDKAGRANTITGKLAGKMGGLFGKKSKAAAADAAGMNPVSGMSAAVGGETQAAQGKLAGFVNSVGNLFKSIGTGISTAFQGIGTGISTALQGASRAISSLSLTGAASFAVIVGTISLALVGLAKCRGDVLPFLQGLSDIFTSLVGGVLQQVGAFILQIAGVFPILASALAQLSPLVEAFGTAIGNAAPGIAAFGTAISEIAQGVGQGISLIAQGIGQGIANIITAIGPMAPLVAQAIAIVINAISTGAAQIGPVISQIVTALQPIVSDICNVFNTLLSQISPIIDSIGQAFERLGSGIKTALEGVSGVVDSIGGAIRNFLDGISGIIDSVGNAALNAGRGFRLMGEGLKIITSCNLGSLIGSLGSIAMAIGPIAKHGPDMLQLGTGFQTMASSMMMLSASFSSMQGSLQAIPGLLTQVSASMDQITGINDKLAPAVAGVQASLSSMQSAFTMVYAAILNVVTTAMNRLPQITTSAMTRVVSITTTMLSGLSAVVSSMMAGVVAAFQAAMAQAVAAVSAGMAQIRGIMSVAIQGPKLAVPHVSVSGSFSLNPPSAPQFSVSYYKNGGILSGAQLFGMMGNTGLVGGEAGPEAVLPLSTLWDKMDAILSNAIATVAGYRSNAGRLINSESAPVSSGGSATGFVVNFSPVINISGENGVGTAGVESAVSSAISRAKDDLMDELEDLFRERMERAYA